MITGLDRKFCCWFPDIVMSK